VVGACNSVLSTEVATKEKDGVLHKAVCIQVQFTLYFCASVLCLYIVLLTPLELHTKHNYYFVICLIALIV